MAYFLPEALLVEFCKTPVGRAELSVSSCGFVIYCDSRGEIKGLKFDPYSDFGSKKPLIFWEGILGRNARGAMTKCMEHLGLSDPNEWDRMTARLRASGKFWPIECIQCCSPSLEERMLSVFYAAGASVFNPQKRDEIKSEHQPCWFPQYFGYVGAPVTVRSAEALISGLYNHISMCHKGTSWESTVDVIASLGSKERIRIASQWLQEKLANGQLKWLDPELLLSQDPLALAAKRVDDFIHSQARSSNG
jgi:hypothetical protein